MAAGTEFQRGSCANRTVVELEQHLVSHASVPGIAPIERGSLNSSGPMRLTSLLSVADDGFNGRQPKSNRRVQSALPVGPIRVPGNVCCVGNQSPGGARWCVVGPESGDANTNRASW